MTSSPAASSGCCEASTGSRLAHHVPVDPFRVQFLTVTLDSQVVLTLVGLVAAGFIVQLAARGAGVADVGVGTWWDVVTTAVIGARALWVLLHLDYYLRGPLQALVITDGGLHPAGLVLGAAYGVWRLASAGGDDRRPWRSVLELVALGVLVTFLVERAGCALTTCGGGPPTDVAWALRRGDELRQPLALYQAVILAGALLLATEVPRLAGRTFPLALGALALVEVVGLAWGGRGAESLVALVLAGVLALAASSPAVRRRAAAWAPARLSARPGAPVG